jgi:hypothetical protein
VELDAAVQKAAKKSAKEGSLMSDEERSKLVSTEQSLDTDTEAKMPSSISGLENFSLGETRRKAEKPELDAESLFNLPKAEDDDDEDEDD